MGFYLRIYDICQFHVPVPPPLIRGGIQQCFCLTSVAYVGPKTRTERPRKTKIGTGVVTCDSDTTFKVKGQGHQATLLTAALSSGSCSGERQNEIGVGNYCYFVVCLAALGASAPIEGGEGRAHIVAAARLQLVILEVVSANIRIGYSHLQKAHDCYGTLIGNHRWPIIPYRFR